MADYNEYIDEELLYLIRSGSHAAFNELYRRFYRPMFRFAYNIIDDKESCDDIVQDVLSWFWEHKKQHNITNLKSYLLTAVKYQVAKAIRRGKVRQNHLLATVNLSDSTFNEESLELKELQQIINSFIYQLPQKAAVIFRMSREEHMSNKEIATKLGISEGTVSVQIKRALDKLRSNLGGMHFWMHFFL
jgi:RNA polymerase sigma-70 factor (family 1)